MSRTDEKFIFHARTIFMTKDTTLPLPAACPGDLFYKRNKIFFPNSHLKIWDPSKVFLGIWTKLFQRFLNFRM